MVRYITIAGKKQVGKDTSARYIRNIIHSCGVPFNKIHIVHFADALKEACSAIFGIPLSDMETELGKQRKTDVYWPYRAALQWHPGAGCPTKFMTVREILQFVGTELFRNQMDPDIWVRSIFRRNYQDGDIVIIADCRFPNEAKLSKQHGLLLKIERDLPQNSDQHASETALDDYHDYDHIVDNNGSFGQLQNRLEVALKEETF